MSGRILIFAVAASLATPGLAKSTNLDLDKLHFDTVHDVASRAILAVDGDGKPISFLLRIPRGKSLPPHGAIGPIRLVTVVSGTLSWGDGSTVDEAAERSFGSGSVIVIPAKGGEHWAAARDSDVLLQVVLVRNGTLSPEAASQLDR